MITKEEILKKIRRWSKDNGGRTPGEKVFYEHSGIGIYDLHRCGWSNYGELVHSAGLRPNIFDKTKYKNEQLCKIFIKVIREKNKWPTKGYLEVKHHTDPKFPASSTFYKKLGLTGDLANSILNYIEDKKGYNDIKKICDAVLKKYEIQDAKENNLISGFVYLGKQHGKYKIGKAKDLNRRREDITLLGSEPIDWIHTIETDDMNGVEKYWHNRFKEKHKRGEWYNLSSSDIKAFKRWRKIY